MISHVSITQCFTVKWDHFLSETSNYIFYLNFQTNRFYFSVYSWTNTNTHLCAFIRNRNGFKTSSHNLVQFVAQMKTSPTMQCTVLFFIFSLHQTWTLLSAGWKSKVEYNIMCLCVCVRVCMCRTSVGWSEEPPPGFNSTSEEKNNTIKTRRAHWCLCGELVVILRGGQGVTQVPDPASQRPPARGFIVAV